MRRGQGCAVPDTAVFRQLQWHPTGLGQAPQPPYGQLWQSEFGKGDKTWEHRLRKKTERNAPVNTTVREGGALGAGAEVPLKPVEEPCWRDRAVLNSGQQPVMEQGMKDFSLWRGLMLEQ